MFPYFTITLILLRLELNGIFKTIGYLTEISSRSIKHFFKNECRAISVLDSF